MVFFHLCCVYSVYLVWNSRSTALTQVGPLAFLKSGQLLPVSVGALGWWSNLMRPFTKQTDPSSAFKILATMLPVVAVALGRSFLLLWLSLEVWAGRFALACPLSAAMVENRLDLSVETINDLIHCNQGIVRLLFPVNFTTNYCFFLDFCLSRC